MTVNKIADIVKDIIKTKNKKMSYTDKVMLALRFDNYYRLNGRKLYIALVFPEHNNRIFITCKEDIEGTENNGILEVLKNALDAIENNKANLILEISTINALRADVVYVGAIFGENHE